MQFSQLPTLLKLAFAALGGKNTIPVASQLPGSINGASYTDGFPPATRTALVAGGKPPAGLDMNGVLFDLSSHVRWLNAGGPYPYSSAFATDGNVGGYPQGAEIASADLEGTWISQNDNNTDNPDTGPGTKWVPGRAYGMTAVGGLTNANVTLTPAQAAKNKITLAGALTGNVQIIFPTWTREWSVVNNTTGAFTITAKTAAGTGVAIPQNASPTKIVGDGTNITQLPENVAPATASQHAVQFGQVGSLIAQSAATVGDTRNLQMSQSATSASVTFSADSIIVGTSLGGTMYKLTSFSATINLGTTGANGMNAGSAPASGYVAIYAIYNPTGPVAALLGVDVTSAIAPNIAGVSLPPGYTASALISVLPTNPSGQIAVSTYQRGRDITFQLAQFLSTITPVAVATSTSIASVVPKNAIRCRGISNLTTTATASINNIYGSDVSLSGQWGSSNAAATTYSSMPFDCMIVTPQTLFRITSCSAGSLTQTGSISGYSI
ncbi:hypothetical protein [Paraburkholderia saeva]|uniref:hypothetical protein n=1 Tax=Paraburkholderia saeva TaxID=2777537 RepID=UPI001E0EDD98|nr:hypothetical protein [Paraburkholderia saeva]CAG4888032.1 hypothetical protein R52603_00561 [Paraburkholderia saeva]